MKSTLFCPAADVLPDERSYALYLLSVMSASQATNFAHPRLFQVYPLREAVPPGGTPTPLPLTQTSIQTNAAYIVDDNVSLSLWLGGSVPTDFLQATTTAPPPLQRHHRRGNNSGHVTSHRRAYSAGLRSTASTRPPSASSPPTRRPPPARSTPSSTRYVPRAPPRGSRCA